MRGMRIVFLLCVLLSGSLMWAASTSEDFPANGANYRRFASSRPPLLPMPQQVDWKETEVELTCSTASFDATSLSEKELADAKFVQTNKELSSFLKAHEVGFSPEGFAFSVEKGLPAGIPDSLKDWQKSEAYGISVSAKGVVVTTLGVRGLYNALQTIKQLIVRRKGKTTIAACSVTDWPDLQIRGFMNDVGRNYLPLSLIRQEIDQMALLKFNTYHFHCCDNNGWRMQSRIYPELNAKKNMDRMPGKFYTQAEFRELVEYCYARNITLIPEMDMPGHSAAFRKAMGVDSMNSPRATEALEKLIAELASLVPADRMPYIHIGTDEVREKAEMVDNATLRRYFDAVEKAGRTPIRWQPGLNPPGYNGAVQHLWSGRAMRRSWPTEGARYIDSHDSYVNHLDPFEVACTFYFRRPCPYKNAEGMGYMLCAWPDLPIENPRNHVLQTPIYSAMAFCSESMWNNPHEPLAVDPLKDELRSYFSNLPMQGSDLLKGFAECEDRVLAIRDRFFVNREFNYVRQADCPWKLIGPFPHGGNVERSFGPERMLKTGKVEDSYTEDGKEYRWHEGEYSGHTIIFKHYCDYPTPFNNGNFNFPNKNCTYYALQYIYSPKNQRVPFWVSGHTWATSDWRNGPVSVPGEWFHAKPKFWVNGKEIEPPTWKKPGNNGAMADENYHFRKPTMIALKKGWNQVLIKSPNNNNTRRWMFTFCPVNVNPETPGCNVKEFPGLKFSVSPGKRE